MAAHLATHQPIGVVRTVSGNSPQIIGYSEKAGQTFKQGTPVQLTSGVALVWDGTTVAAGILGIACNAGSNLATDGKGAPGPFGPVGPPGAVLYQQNVQNQSAAFNIPHGSPAVDGRQLVEIANDDTIFEAMVDNNTGASYTLAAANIGVAYGLTVDTNGFWYVDLAKTTTSACVVILQANPNDGFIANARVFIQFISAARQLLV